MSVFSSSNAEVYDYVESSSDAYSSDFAYFSDLSAYGPGFALSDSSNLLESSENAESVTVFTPLSLLSDSETDYANCLRLDCSIGGDDCIVLFPPEYIDKIFIDESGRLFNMSASQITGRIVDQNFNPYATTGKLVYLSPCLGNNFSTINSYGSPNYVRSYYWSSNRLTYDDTYTEIIVTDYHYPYFASDMWNYAVLFILLIGVILLWLRNYKNY